MKRSAQYIGWCILSVACGGFAASVGGCGGTFDEQVLQGLMESIAAPEWARRARGSAQCQSAACDKNDWAHVWVSPSGSVVPVGPWHTCIQEYSLDFVSLENNPVVDASVNVSQGLRLAVVTADGALHLAEFGSESAAQSSALEAVAVAWSTGGDRLAVVANSAGTISGELLILDGNLTMLQALGVELAEAADPADGRAAFVSWNADDTLVAVSTGVSPPANIVNVDDATVRQFALTDVFFVGANQIVAKSPTCGKQCLWQYALDGTELFPVAAIPDASSVITSYAPASVFVTREPDIPWQLSDGAVGLRTSAAGPDVFAYGVWSDREVLLIAPLETALPVFEAAGFGPEDAPLLDKTGGCPERH